MNFLSSLGSFVPSNLNNSNNKNLNNNNNNIPDINTTNYAELTQTERVSRLYHAQIKQKLMLQKAIGEPIVEQFIVAGIDIMTVHQYFLKSSSPTKTIPPKILFRYPPTKDNRFAGIESCCFPQDVPVRKIQRTPSRSSLFQVVYKQERFINSEKCFMFQLTSESAEIFYGICVLKEEPIEYSPSFMETEESLKEEEPIKPLPKIDISHTEKISTSEGEFTFSATLKTTNSDRTKKDRSLMSKKQVEERYLHAAHHLIIPRCYCIVSRFPFFKFHLEVLQSILAIEQCYTIGSITLAPAESSEEITQSLPKFDSKFCRDTIMDILKRYFDLQVPKHGRYLTFNIPEDATIKSEKKLRYDRPLSDETEYALCDWSFPLFFSAFNYKQFIEIFTCILLEKKLVFYSTNLRRLSAIVFSAIPLIRPFVWTGLYIPILPQKLYTILDAPLSFIVGVTQKPKIDQGLVLVNIDERKIEYDPKFVYLPRLPNFEKFRRITTEPITELVAATLEHKNPYTTSDKEIHFSTLISSILERYLSELFTDFPKFCLRELSNTSTVTVFLQDEFEKSIHKEDKPFMDAFFMTQMWATYKDKKCLEMDQ